MSDEPTTGSGEPEPDGPADDELLAELRSLAHEVDPVPPDAVAAARSAIAWRTIDAELAELTADTSVDAGLAGVRGAAAPAMLTFEAGDVAVEVEVVVEGESRRLYGQLVPPGPGEVEIRHGSERLTVAADGMGRFTAAGLGAGPLSVRCQVGGRVVETDWFLA